MEIDSRLDPLVPALETGLASTSVASPALPMAPLWRVSQPSPSPSVEASRALPPIDFAKLPVMLGGAVAGSALFGFALRTAAEKALPGLGHLAWTGAMPLSLGLAWLVSLPALYVFWASRQHDLDARSVLVATADALIGMGAALASTAPVLWFFAVTAPHSRILSPMGLVFTLLAMLASGSIFGKRLREKCQVPALVHLGFMALVILSFVQFAHAAGIHWF
jgi:hypothetical protein